MKFFLLIITLIFTISSFSQQDGYWDKDRATSKEIKVNAGKRIIVKSEDFPVGTTEIVYRITVLDDNQQMANSLVSVLKAIPDPTGISQGSAGAVFLLSKVSGDDKCKYAIFNTNTLATSYKSNGKTDKGCWSQDTPISKDAKVLSLGKSTCLQPNSTNVWFGFESKNWIMKQKIILEIVPWVDNKLSRGWNLTNRKKMLAQCKNTELALKLQNSDGFCACVLNKIQKEYKYQEFQSLLDIEKERLFKEYGNACLNETGAENTLSDSQRTVATNFAKQGKYGEAISQLNSVINSGKANVNDYNEIGLYYIYTKQFEKALKFLKTGAILDPSELSIQLNLAHTYMFLYDINSAKKIHKKYKEQNVNATESWKERTNKDFTLFMQKGLPEKNFKKIIKTLE
ncbi:MAG: tetratricopeptide repeat protein [Bacteroidota bacterium]